MSATKHARKQVKLMTFGELMNWENCLELQINETSNPMVRSSLRAQLQIVRDEQKVRINKGEGE